LYGRKRKKPKKRGAGDGERSGGRPEAEQVKEEGMSDEIVREFLLERNENLDRLDRELVSLEKIPTTGRRCRAFFERSTRRSYEGGRSAPASESGRYKGKRAASNQDVDWSNRLSE
jgi:hypothetical protein